MCKSLNVKFWILPFCMLKSNRSVKAIQEEIVFKTVQLLVRFSMLHAPDKNDINTLIAGV